MIKIKKVFFILICIAFFVSGLLLGRIIKPESVKESKYQNAYVLGWNQYLQGRFGGSSDLYDDYYLGRNYENRFKSEKEAFETGYYDSFVYINHVEPSEEEKEIIDRLLNYEISLYFNGE